MENGTLLWERTIQVAGIGSQNLGLKFGKLEDWVGVTGKRMGPICWEENNRIYVSFLNVGKSKDGDKNFCTFSRSIWVRRQNIRN